ncbi:hypothetical protein PO909_008719 [Leuciscus waleckii]
MASRVDELGSDLKIQLKEKAKDFVAYSLAIDESADRTDTAQLSIFIRGVDDRFSVTDELLDLKAIHGTTSGQDIFSQVEQCVNDMELQWNKLVALTTDGAPAMCGEVRGLVGLVREKMRHTGENLTAYHCIIHQEALCGKVLGMGHVMTVVNKTVNFIRSRGLNHRQFRALLEEENSVHEDVPYYTEVRWLSRGKVLRRFYDTRIEIARFMESKQKVIPELEDEKWLSDLSFLCDITEHLNTLNVKLQGRKQLITEMRDSVKAFQMKLRLWEGQMRQGNLSHFPICQSVSDTVTIPFPAEVYADKLNTLKVEFCRRFADFERQKFNLDLFANPFAVDVDTAPEHLQMELIELQCNTHLKSRYESVGAAEFAPLLPESMPQLRLHAARIMSMFGSTYSCEQMFSIMKLTKTSHRSRLTDQHLVSVMKVAMAKDINPRIDEMVSRKRCRVSDFKFKLSFESQSGTIRLSGPHLTTRDHNRSWLVVTPVTDAQCKTTAKADIVLLVDGSWSIGRLNFKTIRAFIGRMVGIFDIGPDRVQIGNWCDLLLDDKPRWCNDPIELRRTVTPPEQTNDSVGNRAEALPLLRPS